MKSDVVITDDDALLCLTLLSNHPLFSAFPAGNLSELINECTVQTYLANEAIVKEGDLVDAVYFILKGFCEVRKNTITTSGETLEQPIATLREEESIGLSNAGLYSSTGSRTATIVTLTEVKVLCLDIKLFRQFLANHPNADQAFSHQLDMLKRMLFIKSVAPFAAISNNNIKHIAEQIEEKSIPSGATIFEQGDAGDACYIITAGIVEISIRSDDGSKKILVNLTTNSIFGESALMMAEPRNATARAIESTTLLKIDRPLFIEITQQNANEQQSLMRLQLERCRPKKLENIDVYSQLQADGDEVIILRNNALGKYIQLSGQGLFMWDLLDGELSINEIALQYYLEFNAFNVEEIAGHILNLHNAGFVQLNLNEKMIPISDKKIPRWVHVFSKIREVMEYRMMFGNADEWLTKVFNRVGWIFYTRPAQVFSMLIVMLGFASFVAHFEHAIQLLASSPNKWTLFFLQAFLLALTIPLHELAHAFTTKYYGRKVHCFGFGWLWFSPFAYCDTSDMWLSPIKQRVMVDLAGVYLNAIFAGLAGLCAFFVSPTAPELLIVLELFALSSYLFIIANLDTAFEFDGYYALMDLLDKPNLRLASIKWAIGFFSIQGNASVMTRWKNIRQHYKETLYWFSTLIYLFVIGTVVPYVVFTYLLAGLFGVTNPIIVIVMTIVAVTLSSLGIYKEILLRLPSKKILHTS